MFCELKQTVLSLGQELTPAEIRIGRETPSWVVETGMPTFDPVAKPERRDAYALGSLTTGRFVTVPKLREVDERHVGEFDNLLIRHGSQTEVFVQSGDIGLTAG